MGEWEPTHLTAFGGLAIVTLFGVSPKPQRSAIAGRSYTAIGIFLPLQPDPCGLGQRQLLFANGRYDRFRSFQLGLLFPLHALTVAR